MSDNLLRRYVGHRRGEAGEDDLDGEAAEEVGAFGWLRGAQDRPAMLELRKRGGEALAISYGFLDRVEYDPSQGVTLHHGERKVRIRGCNLAAEVRPNLSLLSGLFRHRVRFVREADHAQAMRAGDAQPLVESIEW